MRSWAWFVGSLAISAALTALLWASLGPGFALVLALPFLFMPRRAAAAPCPTCGTAPRPGDRFCPRDGTPLP